jgi:hypothetical protein
MSTVTTRHHFKGNAESLRLALIKEVQERIDSLPNYGNRRVDIARMRGEQDSLELLLHMLERLTIEDAP